MRFVLILIALIALVWTGAAFWPGPGPVSHAWLEARVTDRAERIAHAGGLKRAPANTLEALAQAVEDGADVLEVDTQMTADGVLVLMHDDTVDRTTNGSGLVSELTLEQIVRLDAAFGYAGEDPDRFMRQGVRVPTLAEAFDAHRDMRWIAEIKPDTQEAALAMCQTIREAGMADRVMVGSFHDNAMAHFREACPEVATGMASNEALSFYIAARAGVADLHPTRAHALQIPPRASGLDVTHPRLIEAAHARGLLVQVWTINDPAEMEGLMARGVDGIITDRVDVMAGVQAG
ncbi:glycerophosphodiester phosphodiesterase [Alkalicaulis satelles]|uniref:Glycerophosphodiester phosphodiesterase n=1 Tax=Alkalicaulis satelles TaxID=2609175 RepID=A0A5M6ZGR2_9PROT|nr:glycerophosphodiester phosphodiesterase [Alkalicaulis satelles]KAA5803500.1 glycerophosphodiester phosphodiesterase [Alkalicaulis satelles]